MTYSSIKISHLHSWVKHGAKYATGKASGFGLGGAGGGHHFCLSLCRRNRFSRWHCSIRCFRWPDPSTSARQGRAFGRDDKVIYYLRFSVIMGGRGGRKTDDRRRKTKRISNIEQGISNVEVMTEGGGNVEYRILNVEL